jgi:hypothetical protein
LPILCPARLFRSPCSCACNPWLFHVCSVHSVLTLGKFRALVWGGRAQCQQQAFRQSRSLADSGHSCQTPPCSTAMSEQHPTSPWAQTCDLRCNGVPHTPTFPHRCRISSRKR